MYYIDCLACDNSFTMECLNCNDEDCNGLYCMENDTRVDECEFCNKFNR